MKYLLYYNLDSDFVNDQTACGGDGTNVVSVVDGVAFAWLDRYTKAVFERPTSYLSSGITEDISRPFSAACVSSANTDNAGLTDFKGTGYFYYNFNITGIPANVSYLTLDAAFHYRFRGYGAKETNVITKMCLCSGTTPIGDEFICTGNNTGDNYLGTVSGACAVSGETADIRLRINCEVGNYSQWMGFLGSSVGVEYHKNSGTTVNEKVYYRYAKPNDTGSVTSYTVTVHYIDSIGKTLAQDDVYAVDTYIGKSTKFFIAPKSIENYVPIKSGVSVTVSSNTEYNLIYGKNREEMLDEPLTFNIISGGNIYWVTSTASYTRLISYSKNGGSWYSIRSNTGSSAPRISVSAGDIIQFKGNNTDYATSSYYTYFSASTGTKFSVEGNIMSLINSTGFSTATTLQTTYTFKNLFQNCDKLIGALDLVLPATTLANNCYQGMFNNCYYLTTSPELPATALANYCYYEMFASCTSLTTAPALPATTLADYCYSDMFAGCTSLTVAPELPATTLADYCYYGMFNGCSGLTSAPAILPATTLRRYCYNLMFFACTSLTRAPELPATTLAERCYYYMFRGCRNLNYIKCLATNISATYCTTDWVYGVPSTGTFVKNPSMSSWTTGSSGIPNNWTVQDAS